MGRIRVGPARIPDRESPERAVELLVERGYDACEIDFESGFWMDYPWAERLGVLGREHDIALSVHAPLFGWVGHLETSGPTRSAPRSTRSTARRPSSPNPRTRRRLRQSALLSPARRSTARAGSQMI